MEEAAARWWITRRRVQCEGREGGILKTRQKQRLENKDATELCVREGGLVDRNYTFVLLKEATNFGPIFVGYFDWATSSTTSLLTKPLKFVHFFFFKKKSIESYRLIGVYTQKKVDQKL